MTTTTAKSANPLRGILLMLTAVTLFTIMSSLIKAADRIPPGEAVFFRSFVALLVLVGWFAARGEIRNAVYTRNWVGHARRALVGTAAMGLGFAGLRFLPLPEVTALQFATPLLIVILAAIMLGERVRAIRISAVIVGLIGVGIILAPRLTVSGNSTELLGAALVLGSATCAALAQIFIKRLAGVEHTAAIVFYFSLTASLLSLLTIPFGWVMPVGAEWALLIGAGTIGAVGQICLTTSYTQAEAGVLAPFTYVSILWALLIGWLAFDEIPTQTMLLGAALIVSAGAVIAFRERQLGKRMATEGKVRAKGWQ